MHEKGISGIDLSKSSYDDTVEWDSGHEASFDMYGTGVLAELSLWGKKARALVDSFADPIAEAWMREFFDEMFRLLLKGHCHEHAGQLAFGALVFTLLAANVDLRSV